MGMLDERTLDELGMADLTEAQRRRFLSVIQTELKIRVGKEMSFGLSDSQIHEFESIIKNDAVFNRQWLERYQPKYAQSDVYLRLASNGYKGDNLINKTAGVLWLRQNRSDYQKIVEACKREICGELRQYRNGIIARASP
ncbi:hypothetical protein FACS1894187_24110 [Synergistales bacterium]|nr:hypothetical protein FACS1894187_24110 [Synergistales bacterium]